MYVPRTLLLVNAKCMMCACDTVRYGKLKLGGAACCVYTMLALPGMQRCLLVRMHDRVNEKGSISLSLGIQMFIPRLRRDFNARDETSTPCGG